MITNTHRLAAAVAVVLSIGFVRASAGNRPDGPVLKGCDLAALQAVQLDHAAVRSAQPIAAGAFTPPRAQAPLAGLPAFCRIEATSTPTRDSVITFEVWIPDETTWNGKVVATGNGGYSNVPAYRDMGYALQQGYAVIGGDTGHQTATPDDLLWGVDHPEKIIDWGTRSIHVITVAGKAIVAAYQGKAVRRAYYYGCSTGGHQGYAEIQRYPQDFDGVVAGAPGNNRVRLTAAFLWQFLANHQPHDNSAPIIPASKLPMITRAVVSACDAKDGVADGVLDDPRSCVFDPAVLQCSGADEPTCLTSAQVTALNRLYGGARNSRTGAQVYPGWPKGTEAGWPQYWGTTEPARANLWRYWVFNNPQWDWWTFDFDRDLALADARVGGMVDQTNTDISRFKARGGKAIVYHGWQDPVSNPLDTIAYYDGVRTRQGSQAATDAFFRLFLVPGMGHCSGGAGTANFGNQGAPSPTVDADHDVLSALDRWVERGMAPATIVASRVVNGAATRTRPLCPYPTKAVYSGTASTDDAASFMCR